MVKAVDGWEFNNVAGVRCSYGTTVRRIAIQGLVCSPRMVVIQIRRHKSFEKPFVEHSERFVVGHEPARGRRTTLETSQSGQ